MHHLVRQEPFASPRRGVVGVRRTMARPSPQMRRTLHALMAETLSMRWLMPISRSGGCSCGGFHVWRSQPVSTLTAGGDQLFELALGELAPQN